MTERLFRIAKIEIVAVSFTNNHKSDDEVAEETNCCTKLFTLDESYIGTLDGFCLSGGKTLKELFD